MVHDLKQQLERAEAARAQAEIHLAELRRTQKAVGQPTEVAFCHTMSLQRVVAESRQWCFGASLPHSISFQCAAVCDVTRQKVYSRRGLF